MSKDRLYNTDAAPDTEKAAEENRRNRRRTLQSASMVSVKAREVPGGDDLQIVEMSDSTAAAKVLELAKIETPEEKPQTAAEEKTDGKSRREKKRDKKAEKKAEKQACRKKVLETKSENVSAKAREKSPAAEVPAEKPIESKMAAHKAAVSGSGEAEQAAQAVQTKAKPRNLPETDDIRSEYERVSYRERLRKSIVSTTNILIVVAAIAILTAMLFLPVLRIYGHSMNNTLESGELVVSLKGAKFNTGDIIAFYYNNNILVKRVIANSGDWVDIDLDGNVYVNQKKIDEPYLKEKAYGDPNIDFPYQVPEDRVFVLGDNRAVSVDSRSKSMGCVSSEQIVGKVVFRVWPFDRLGPLK